MSNLPNFPILRPSLLLDFANSKQVDPRITFTRASTATYYDAQGVLRTAASGVPRIDHDPVTGECKGLLIEEARTNLLLNSATLGTQSVTVTAVAMTLSFYGSGSVSLSGAHTATLSSAGAYPARAVLTFTPAAGTLTLTVTGEIRDAQLEAGSFPTSYTPTGGSAATRAADAASMTGTNFSEWYRQDEGTFVAEFDCLTSNPTVYGFGRAISVNDGTTGNETTLLLNAVNDTAYAAVKSEGVSVFNTGGTANGNVAVSANTAIRASLAYKQNDFACSMNGGTVQVDSSGNLPVGVYQLRIGNRNGGEQLNGHILRIAFFPKRLANAELQALTA